MTIEIENNSVLKISSNKNYYNYKTTEIKKIYININKIWILPLKKYSLVIILKNGKKEKINLEKKYKESIKKFVMDYNYNLSKNRHTLI
jgi:hypothetical protein